MPPFKIGGTEISPHSREQIELPVARLPTQTQVSLPINVIRGREEGPVLWVSAAIHGDEINGVEIVRRLMDLVTPKSLQGTLIMVPIVNVFGFIEQSRYLPDRRDLNRSFPGSSRGSLASRLASLFMREVVSQSTHGIDIHTASDHRVNLPQIRANLEDSETYRCVRSPLGPPWSFTPPPAMGPCVKRPPNRGFPSYSMKLGKPYALILRRFSWGLKGSYG